MKEYHKIQSMFKRDEKTHRFIENQWSLPEFEYLKNNKWIFTEKIDGTNIRVDWNGKETITYGGRTDNAQIPAILVSKLQTIFTNVFRINYMDLPMTLYGEGYGAKIQKGGGNYIPDGVGFILFDVMIDGWWLKRDSIENIAEKLSIKVVPIIGSGTLYDAIGTIKVGLKSQWGDFQAEGMVLKPEIELKDRAGKRIITKLKHKDFAFNNL